MSYSVDQGHAVLQCNPDECQREPRLGGKAAAGCGHRRGPRPAPQANDRLAQRRHHLRQVATALHVAWALIAVRAAGLCG